VASKGTWGQPAYLTLVADELVRREMMTIPGKKTANEFAG